MSSPHSRSAHASVTAAHPEVTTNPTTLPSADLEARLRESIRLARAHNDARGRIRGQIKLAYLWRTQGAYRKAGLLLRFTLESAQEICGPDSVEVVSAANELAVWGKYTGAFDLAHHLYQRILAVLEKRHGLWHPDVATVCHNIGGLLHASGDYAAGEPWARRSMVIRERLLGRDHPQTAADAGAWAALLEGLGQYEEAREILQRCLEVYLRHYGAEHHETVVTEHNMAAIAHRTGDLEAARSGYQRALDGKERLLGRAHPECAPTLVNLAAVFRAQGDTARALEYYTRAIDILDPVVASDYPVLVVARHGHEALQGAFAPTVQAPTTRIPTTWKRSGGESSKGRLATGPSSPRAQRSVPGSGERGGEADEPK